MREAINMKEKTFKDKFFEKFENYVKEIVKRTAKSFYQGILKREIFKSKERYVFNTYLILGLFATTYIMLTVNNNHRIKEFITNWGIIYSSIITLYFVAKANLSLLRDFIIFSKYTAIIELFNNKVKVLEFKSGIYKLHSYLTESEIQSKQERIEHCINKTVTAIYKDKSNFKIIYISTVERSSKQLRSKYNLSDHIGTIDVSKYKLPFLLGVDEKGSHVVADLKTTKHILISGETGGGKTTLEHCILQSLMWYNSNISYILVDFNCLGFYIYKQFKNCLFIRHHDQFLDVLKKLNAEMEERVNLIMKKELEDIWQYNKKVSEPLPFIVLLIDEMADLKFANEKDTITESELILRRLINMARKTGIYIIAATQKPSAQQLSPEVKAQLTTKLSFRVDDTYTQGQTGIKDSQCLEEGQFKVRLSSGEKTLKGYFVDRIEQWSVFEELKKAKGGVSNEKKLFEIEEKN
jgi:hypothetical protein